MVELLCLAKINLLLQRLKTNFVLFFDNLLSVYVPIM